MDKKIIENLKAVIEAYESGRLTAYLSVFRDPLKSVMRPILKGLIGEMFYNVEHYYDMTYMTVDEIVAAVRGGYPVELCNTLEEARGFIEANGYNGLIGYKTFKGATPKVYIGINIIDRLHAQYAHYTLLSVLGITQPRNWDGHKNPFLIGSSGIDSSNHRLSVNGQRLEAKLHADGRTLEVRGLTEPQIRGMVRMDVAGMYSYDRKGLRFNSYKYDNYIARLHEDMKAFAEDARAEFEALEEGKVSRKPPYLF